MWYNVIKYPKNRTPVLNFSSRGPAQTMRNIYMLTPPFIVLKHM